MDQPSPPVERPKPPIPATPVQSPRARRAWLALGIAALVAIGVVLAVVVPRRGDDSAAGGSTATPSAAASSAGGTPSGMVVLAHQGGFETYPHETTVALVAAAKSGATPEVDVQWTFDNVAVLVHDDDTTPAAKAGPVNPMVCHGGPYRVSTTNWKVLQDNCRTIPSASKDRKTYPIPTFDEAVKAISAVPGAQLVAELKVDRLTPTQTQDYLATVTKYGMTDRIVVSSFFPEALKRMQAEAVKQKLTLRYLRLLRATPGQPLPTAAQLHSEGLWGVALRSNLVTPGNVAGLHAEKLIVAAWTLNGVPLWDTAKKAGVDLVYTDQPDAYQKWLTQ